MRVKFLRDELYEHEGRNQGHLYREGEVYDFEPAFAERWLRRDAVVLIDPDGKPPKPEARFTPLNNVAPRDGEQSDAARRAAKGAPSKAKGKSAAAKPPAPKPPAEKPAETPAETKPEASSSADEKKAEEPAKAATTPLEPPKPGQAG